MTNIRVENQDRTSRIMVNGDFVFDTNREFREAYRQCPPDNHFVIDLKNANYMDSAGLGMLIQLREFAGGDNASIRLTGLHETVRTILTVANFGLLFELDEEDKPPT